ncbi:MAG: tetraacyldisaccharide 4'-kinase [Castellaniella sp.]
MSLTRAVQHMWQRRGLASTLLLPLSWLAGGIIARRRRRYTHNPALIWQSPVPLVIVGNLYVGGTGKTPVVMALVKALAARGWHPGVVSRGYGAQRTVQPQVGRNMLDPAIFGDEPALIARHTGVPVAVHADRPLAAQALLRARPEVDVIVADDGLQHYRLGRDIEILVEDERGIGNGRVLPAGPLREPAARRDTVDIIITHMSTIGEDDHDTREHPPEAAAHHGPQRVGMRLQACRVRRLSDDHQQNWADWLAAQGQAPVHAIAGIGRPGRFFAMLRAAGVQLEQARALPDHARLHPGMLETMGDKSIMMTAKDAVKCAPWADNRLHAVEVEAVFDSPTWLQTLERQLREAAAGRSTGGIAG